MNYKNPRVYASTDDLVEKKRKALEKKLKRRVTKIEVYQMAVNQLVI